MNRYIQFAAQFALIMYVAIYNMPRQGRSPQTSAVTNCLRNMQDTSVFPVAFWNSIATPNDPILNRHNIASALGAPAHECELFIDNVVAAYTGKKLLTGMFKIVLGLDHDFKAGIASQVRSKEGALAALYPEANTVLFEKVDEAADPGSVEEKVLHYPINLIKHEFGHKFWKLFKENGGDVLMDAAFYSKAKSEFERSMNRLDKLSKLYESNRSDLNAKDKKWLEEQLEFINTESIQGLEAFDNRFAFFRAVNVIKMQLEQHYEGFEERVEEMFTHLIQVLPEKMIERYFPFFHAHHENMIFHFRNHTLLPRSNALPEGIEYTHAYVVEKAQCISLAKDLTGSEFEDLDRQVKYFIHNDKKDSIMNIITRFESERSSCALNILQKSDPAHYALGNKIAGTCYYFVGNNKQAAKYFHNAWKEHRNTFTEQEVIAYFNAAQQAQIGIEGSLRRAYDKTQNKPAIDPRLNKKNKV